LDLRNLSSKSRAVRGVAFRIARGVAWSRKAGPRRLNLVSAMDARGVTAMTMRYDRINKAVLNAAASGPLLRRWVRSCSKTQSTQ
jgi:hypothetical protein